MKTYILAFYGPQLVIVCLSLSLTNSLTVLVGTSWLTGRSNDNLKQADVFAFDNVCFLYFCILSFCLSVFRPFCLSVSTERGKQYWRILPYVRHSTNRGRNRDSVLWKSGLGVPFGTSSIIDVENINTWILHLIDSNLLYKETRSEMNIAPFIKQSSQVYRSFWINDHLEQ